jgi:hypothetical protein
MPNLGVAEKMVEFIAPNRFLWNQALVFSLFQLATALDCF